MSEDPQGSSGAPVESASGVDAETTSQTKQDKDVVAYETYRKTLSEAKKAKEALEAVNAERQKLLDEKMAAEGKKDELIGSKDKRIQELEGKLKKVVGAFGHKQLASVVSQEAAKEGCIDVGALLALSDLSAVEVDDEFNVNVEQVRDLVQAVKREKSYLFNKPVTSAKTGVPTTGVTKSADDWAKLPLAEQAKLAMKLLNEKR